MNANGWRALALWSLSALNRKVWLMIVVQPSENMENQSRKVHVDQALKDRPVMKMAIDIVKKRARLTYRETICSGILLMTFMAISPMEMHTGLPNSNRNE